MIAYRATVYAPKSVDATETTVLTPRAGAAHSDPFKVATVTGVSGFQPYLNRVVGRAGGIDPLTKAVDTGTLRLEIGDIRVAADTSDVGLQRWVTAFTADSANRWQLPACKVVVEIARDWDASTLSGTWATYFTGRAGVPSTESLLRRGLRLTDFSTDLEQPVFTEDPHASITYAARARLWPVGLPIAWGGTAAQDPIEMVYQDSASFPYTQKALVISAFEPSAPRIATKDLAARIYNVYEGHNIRLRVRPQTGTNAGVTLTVPILAALAADVGGGADGVSEWVLRMDDLPSITVGAVCDVWADAPAGEPVSGRLPILVSDVHPVTFLADLLDGYFGQLNTSTGNPDFPVTRLTSSFTTLASDTTLPTLRFVIEKKEASLKAFITKEILEPCNLGYRFDEQGRFVLLDLRAPTTVPSGADLITLTDDDLLAVPDRAQWAEGAQSVSRLVGTYYVDTVATDSDLRDLAQPPDIAATRLTSTTLTHTYYAADARGLDVARKPHEIAARGFRTGINEDGGGRQTTLTQQFDRLGAAFDSAFGLVPMVASVRCKNGDGAPAEDAVVGKYLSLDTSALENPETCERGGALLFRIIEVSDEGIGHLERRLTALYLGDDPVDGPPSPPTAASVFGSPTSSSGVVRFTMPASNLPDLLRILVDGSYWGADVTRTAGASATQDVTVSGLPTASTSYSVTALGVSAAGVESLTASPAATLTTAAASAIPAPTLGGSQTSGLITLTITPGVGTPSGVVWVVEMDGSEFDRTAAVSYQQIVPAGSHGWTVYGTHDDYPDSADSNTVTLP